MKKKKKIIFKRKKIIIILFIIISFFVFKFCVNAIKNSKIEQKKILEEKTELKKIKNLDKKLNQIFLNLEKTKTKAEQKYIYKKLVDILQKYSLKFFKDKDNYFLKDYLIKKIIQKNNSIILDKKNFLREKIKILKISNNNYKKELEKFLNKNKKIN
jgi:hypothetical protein